MSGAALDFERLGAPSALAIVRAREKAEKTLGAKFNIRAFHDAVLELGSVPVPVVTARVDRFIAEGGKRPLPGYGVSRSWVLGSTGRWLVVFGGSPNVLLRNQNASIISRSRHRSFQRRRLNQSSIRRSSAACVRCLSTCATQR